jgi:hypothetical protein
MSWLLTKIECDGCGRGPTFREWMRGELTFQGYPEWRHPGIAFRQAGCPLSRDNMARAARLFPALFGRPMPYELSFLCPECQQLVLEELPALYAADTADPEATQQYMPGHFFG